MAFFASACLIESIIEISHNEGIFLNHLQSSQETMHSSSAMISTLSLSLSLPPELWSMILSTFRSSLLDCFDKENAKYLWTQCRLVSKQFKHEIESMFIDAHLPKMLLYVDIISCYDGIEYCFYDVVHRRQTTFVGLAENRDVGIARVDDEYWRSFLQPHGGDDRKEKMPYHVVQIFRYGTSGRHSPAEVRDDLDIEFDWRALLTGTFTQGKRCSMKCGHVSLGMIYSCSSKSANTNAERLVGD